MPKKVLFMDEDIFVTAMTQAVAEGNTSFIESHADRLDALVERLGETLQSLTELQYRARQATSPAEAVCH
jgi:hypothetical protein